MDERLSPRQQTLTLQQLGMCVREARHKRALDINQVAITAGVTPEIWERIETGVLDLTPPIQGDVDRGLGWPTGTCAQKYDEIVSALVTADEQQLRAELEMVLANQDRILKKLDAISHHLGIATIGTETRLAS